MNQQIKNLAIEKSIPYLLHFTKAENLASIMQNGIVPVGYCQFQGINPAINDHGRFDYQRGASCLSIAFPNHRMFYKYRKENENIDWVVLAVKAEVLWTKDCAFCQRNAADGMVTQIPINERKTLAAFSAMYQEIEGERSRAEQKLKNFDPTHDQAEVLVFDVIEPGLIFGGAFNSASAKAAFSPLLGGREVLQNGSTGGLFGSRSYAREF